MTVKPQYIQRILVIGAGRGGLAMLDLFREDPMINIIGIIDTDPQAPALEIARKHGILDFTDLSEAIEASRPCLAFNLTGDDSITAYIESQLGSENIIGGFQARFIWTLLTRLKQTNEQIIALAHHDSLTGLPNRILFYDRLNQAITRALRDKESIAVLYLDLDGFKHINDTLGHDAGDALLREAAKRIMACVRESDTVARIGGDEFTVILCNAQTTSSNDHVAKKIVDAIAYPFMINGKNCTVSASIGIAIYPDHGETAEQLVKIADAAMYLAKHSGKNCCRYTKPPSGCISISNPPINKSPHPQDLGDAT
ncbi:diguanylate cyclase [Ferrovum sp.]|uniref:diguanylate cyclase domain-containing protein n=2 Tax=Ferrovum sp. TaxID=2609467 RepID=UPI00262E96E6|nr:diguanylate cyclase [Ferrovum sp.]